MEAFVRWQGRTVEQFGYAVNLILGLSVAALGFVVSLLFSESVEFSGLGICFFYLSIFGLVFSITFGLWVVINRLRDFRLTTRIARKRVKSESDDFDLQQLRVVSNALGERTWLVFWWQIGAFAAGVLFMVVAVASEMVN